MNPPAAGTACGTVDLIWTDEETREIRNVDLPGDGRRRLGGFRRAGDAPRGSPRGVSTLGGELGEQLQTSFERPRASGVDPEVLGVCPRGSGECRKPLGAHPGLSGTRPGCKVALPGSQDSCSGG